MKRFIFSIFLIILAGLQVLSASYDSITINPYNMQEIVANSYIRGVISQGDVTRWNKSSFPLKVYIQTDGVPTDYVIQIKKAYAKWQSVTGGDISFTQVKNPSNADMKCYFANDLPNLSEDTVGFHQFKYKGNYIADSVITFKYTDKYGKIFDSTMFYTIALHEIGHSLGLAGHSSNSKDLMYPVTNSKNYNITQRDLTTLKLLYSMVPDITNKDFTSSDKKNLLTKTQVVGGQARLKQDAQTAAKINTKITPNDPSSKLRLAEAYKQNKNYTSAIAEYKSIIPLVDSSEINGSIYAEITDCYIKLKNYTAARNCAVYAYKKHPNDQTATLVPKVQYANGEKTAAVKSLAALYKNNDNRYAGTLLKEIYNKEKNNPSLIKTIESCL